MRIGIDARTLYAPILKGIGVYLENLLNELAKVDQENEYILYYDSRQEIVSRKPKEKNFTEKGIQIGFGDRFYFWEYFCLSQHVKEDKIDVFHFPANTASFLNAPTVVTVHDTIAQDVPRKRLFDRFYLNVIQPFILKYVSAVITPSSFSKGCITGRLRISGTKINVIPQGVDSVFLKIEDQKVIEGCKQRYDIQGSYLFNAGGESPWKNVSLLIHAYADLVKECGINEKLVITGIRSSGILEKHLKEVNDLNLASRVIILGYISKEDLVALYNGAEVFVYPSLKEGFGFPPLEAMACGTPVAASNAASIPEVVGDAGILFDATKVESIASAIKQVLKDSQLKEALRQKGLARAKEFSWEQTARTTMEVYKEAIQLKQSRKAPFLDKNQKRVLIAESGSGYGGTAKYLASFIPLVDRGRFSVEVVSYGTGPFIERIVQQGETIHFKPSWRFPWGDKPQTTDYKPQTLIVAQVLEYIGYAILSFCQLLLMVPAITFWLRRRKIQVVHLNNEVYSHLPLLIAAKLAGCRILCHLHGWREFTLIERLVVWCVDQFVAISEAGAKFFQGQLPNSSVVAIPNGLSFNRQLKMDADTRTEERNSFGLNAKTKVITLVGRLVPWKGHEVFLKALERAVHKNPDVHGLILGHDASPNEEYLLKLKHLASDLGIAAHVTFLPWREDVWPVYAASDVVVHASTQPEPFGFVILEAMFAGKPVIATRGGGVTDLVVDGETGYLIPPDDTEQLANAIQSLTSNHHLACQFAEKGKTRAEELFQIERNAERVQEVYERILKPKSAILIAESGSGYGGSAKYLQNLLHLIDPERSHVEVVAYGNGPYVRKINQEGWTVYFKSLWRFPWFDVGANPCVRPFKGEGQTHRSAPTISFNYIAYAVTAILQIIFLVPVITLWLKRRKIKLVYLNSEILSNLPLLIASRVIGLKTICHLHIWRKFTRTERLFVSLVDRFISVSQAATGFYKKQLPGHRLTTIVNGLPSNDDQKSSCIDHIEVRTKLGLDEKGKVVLMLGRLVPRKGYEPFLNAMAKIIQKDSRVVAVIAGSDPTPDQNYLETLKRVSTELGIESKIHFLPWQEDVEPLYQASDLVVFASTKPEPFPLVILEAMSLGKPVIATKVGGVADLVLDRKTGLLVEPDNADEMAARMGELIGNPDFAFSLGHEAEKRTARMFSMKENASKVKILCQELLNSSEDVRPIGRGAGNLLRTVSPVVKGVLFCTGMLGLVRNSVGTKVPVLMYHRVRNESDPFFPSVSLKTFQKQMEYVNHHYKVLSLDEVVAMWKQGNAVPPQSLVVTFDDSDIDTWSLIRPVTERFKIPLTVFLAVEPMNGSGFTWTDLLRWWIKLTEKERCILHLNGHSSEWSLETRGERLQTLRELSIILKHLENGQRKVAMKQLEEGLAVERTALPSNWVLTKTQIKSSHHDLVKFGAHTLSHPILSRMSREEARYEIFECKRKLEEILSEKVEHFAYPNGEAGDFTEAHIELVRRAGFHSACTTILGLNDERTNRYEIRRIYAKEEPLATFAARLVGLGS
ncbi:MAG: glycosyltransferase [Candidatus Omnitrophica bacterium]|nr:glycosyltransferase [Candidatus Omnitrophota bacterium]